MKACQRQCGMILIALIVMMVIVGALAVAFAPLLLSAYTQMAMLSDRKDLEAAKAAIIGYALSTGKIPYPTDIDGASAAVGTPGFIYMPPSAGTETGVVAALGVNNWGSYGRENPFRMDVNSGLTAAASLKDLCGKAQRAMADALPRVCRESGPTMACAAAGSTPVAFALYSTGSDRMANLNNKSNTRIYENGKRGIDNSAGVAHYDDLVVSYSLSSLINDCASAARLPVCNLNASPNAIIQGCTSTLTASCSNISRPPSPATPYTWWISGVATAPSVLSASTVAPAVTTGYAVSGTNELGTGAATLPATVYVSAPICTVSPPTINVTEGATATFTADCNNAPTSYLWSGGANCAPASPASGIFNTSSVNCNRNGAPYTVSVLAAGACGDPATGAALLSVSNAGAAPTASNVRINGTPQIGYTLTGAYTYADANGDPEGVSTFRWLRNGSTVIAGATAQTYTLTSADNGSTLTFEVTPVALTGAPLIGVPVKSDPVMSCHTISITNNVKRYDIYYTLGDTCPPGIKIGKNGGVASIACTPDTTKLWIYSHKDCRGRRNLDATVLNLLDTNTDGAVICTVSGKYDPASCNWRAWHTAAPDN